MARKQTVNSDKVSKEKPSTALEPRYMRGKKPANVAVHKIADVLALIEKHGHGKKFKRQAKAAGHTITVAPETVNFIKDFLAKNNMHTDRIGRQVFNSNGTYNCDS